MAKKKQNKQEKMTPYKPLPYRDGYTIVKHYEVEEMDELGYKKLLKCCDYRDKKNKLHEKHILQVVQLGNENILEPTEVKKFMVAPVDDSLPFDWYDTYVLGFKRINEKLYVMMAWDYEHGKFWEDIYYEISPEKESEVIDYFKPFGKDEEDEDLSVFDKFEEIKYSKGWVTDIVFIKQTMAASSGVRGDIAKLRHKISIV